MDVVVIVLVLGALAVMIFKKFSSLIYYIGIIDIFLRILDFIANNLKIPVLSDFINTYFPNSVSNIIEIYSSGIFTTVLSWLLLVVYIILDFYLIRIFWKKK